MSEISEIEIQWAERFTITKVLQIIDRYKEGANEWQI